MTDPLTYLPILGLAALAVGVRRLMAKDTAVRLAELEVDDAPEAPETPPRDEQKWRRAYSRS